MPFPVGVYDAETLALMKRAFDDAWKDAGINPAFRSVISRSPTGALMAIRIMAAVKNGERDPARLKHAALTALAASKPTRGG